MSAATEKATRRELRRAVGEEACRKVEAHEQGLKSHAFALRALEQRLKAVGQESAETRDGKDYCRALIDGLERRERQRGASFWARLRWLLTGDVHGKAK